MHPLETFCGVGNRPVDGIVSPALGTKQVFIGLNNILGFPSSSTGKRTHLQCRRSWFDSCVGKFSRRRDRLPTPVSLGFPDSSSWFDSCVGKFSRRRDRLPAPVSLGFPDGSDSKESACNGGDLGSTPGMEKSPGGGHGNPL